MANAVADLARISDLVLIDAAPVLRVDDAASLGAKFGGVLFVLAYGTTTRTQLEHTLKAMDTVGARVLGGVLNFAPERQTYPVAGV